MPRRCVEADPVARRSSRFTPGHRRFRRLFLTGVLTVLALGCDRPDPELVPDQQLRSELGLTESDRVHTIALTSGVAERAEPGTLEVVRGDYVQFVSRDWLVHEVSFPLDSLDRSARDFMTGTGQQASPPLLQRDARFVLSFADAPAGRYPFLLVGNRDPGHGAIVVVDPSTR